jgi:cytoskeletal protein CcmA (bactofilin family)
MAHARSVSRQSGASSLDSHARIGSGARIRGRIQGDGDLTIEGIVEGEIALRGNLTIADGGSVTADAIEAQEVVISGALEGNVNASGTVRVASGSRVRGDLRGSSVSIEEGAEYAGRLECEFDLPAELEGGGEGRGRGRGR